MSQNIFNKNTIISESKDKQTLPLALSLISRGEVIVIPTETVYGIIADSCNPAAVERIYRIKGRKNHMPLQILTADIKQAQEFGEFGDNALKLGRKLWPGALTIIVKKRNNTPLADNINPSGDTIGIRIPDNITALNIINQYGKPLAASSANISGKENALTAEKAYNEFAGKIPLIIDGGKSVLGTASTVVDMTDKKPKILREGSINAKIIEELCKD